MYYFRRSRSGQVHSFMAALTCLRSVETNFTLTCPSPKSFVCNLRDSGRHVTSVFRGLSLSRSVGRVGENPGNEVEIFTQAGNTLDIKNLKIYRESRCYITHAFRGHFRSVLMILRCCLSEHSR